MQIADELCSPVFRTCIHLWSASTAHVDEAATGGTHDEIGRIRRLGPFRDSVNAELATHDEHHRRELENGMVAAEGLSARYWKELNMRKIVSLFAAAVAVTSLAAGCSAEVNTQEDIDANSAPYCSNPEGTNAMIAALAASVGRELHRWQVTTDMYEYRGYYNQLMLGLTPTGLAQCSNGCANTLALLAMQDPRNDGQLKFPGGVTLSSYSYASRLTAGWENQRTCDSRPDNHQGDNCPAEAHRLTQVNQYAGGCSEVFNYNATTPYGGPLMQPAQLKNKLLWAGGTSNPYLQFSWNGSQVQIDPTAGLNDGDYTMSGSCSSACSKFSVGNLTGSCCSCNGRIGTYQSMPTMRTMYTCK